MPFTMTHLLVSEKIAERFKGCITSLPQFYLGSVAPDAVHNRENYVSDYKKAAHLITGTEPWGNITDNDEWESNVIAFLKQNKASENRDFILGYCAHILTDIYNNVHIWTPFRLAYADELAKGYGNINHLECNKLDIAMALTYEGREMFWDFLAQSDSIDLPPLIYAKELDAQKDNILHSWYKDKEYPDISTNTVRTYAGEMELIQNATAFVEGIFQEHLQ